MVWKQSDLFGETLENPTSKEELNKVCCESCYTAKEKMCTCRCHGAFHGLGKLNSRDHSKQEHEREGKNKNEQTRAETN